MLCSYAFWTKKCRATYQRLMDRIFRGQAGRNIEVYVDDILIKSQTKSCFISDLEESFSTLRKHGVKLNPAKCTFEVRSGKFLGFIVTERGIEVNPAKVQAIISMASPSTVKEVQKLTGKIAALSRFISRSAHRSHPFFQILRKAKKFGWDNNCEKAFLELKDHLAELPTLVKPMAGEDLWVYLSTTEHAVSSVLICQEGKSQRSVYYVSHALKGPELRYIELEKLALALITTVESCDPTFYLTRLLCSLTAPSAE